ncbi:hypothetical protein PInf_012369 [Phytophthora infestans]|nr:hypothetical protein PInf_012369 [Phytophthora infestans]
MEETVIFEKVKSNGSTIKKRVPVFRDETWKDWLEWLLRLSEYYVFMGYQNTEDQTVPTEAGNTWTYVHSGS